MASSTGSAAVLARTDRSASTHGIARTPSVVGVRTAGPSTSPAQPALLCADGLVRGAAPTDVPIVRTAAGVRALRRRHARLDRKRRPPSGLLPSAAGTSALVSADSASAIGDRTVPIGRWVRLACTLCFAATAVLVVVVLLSSGGTDAVASVTVKPGDTLWALARENDPGADPRSVVQRIEQLNSMHDDGIVPGVVLLVPVHTP